MEHRIRLNLAVTALVAVISVGASLVTSTVVAARAYEHRVASIERKERTITVKGSTRQRIRSDRAVWSIEVLGQNEDLQQAYATLERGVEHVRDFLQQRGFTPTEFDLNAISTETLYARDDKGNRTHEAVGYALQRSFVITTSDVDRVRRSAGEVTELIKDGVMVFSRRPEFYYTKLPSLKVDLMGAASSDARARADAIAVKAGCRITDVQSAHMGVLQITRPLSTEVASYGIYDTSTIEKDVRAVVTATFRIEHP
jgi:hypothetical protein